MSLVLRDIRHSYGAGAVVDGASLEAAPGEIVVLFGPSGCGKTTLLRIAAGLERLQEGSVELDGGVLANTQKRTPAEKRPIGFVFQDFVLFPHLNIEKNVAFGLRDLPRSERAARVDSELLAVGLEEFRHRFPHQLSGGQQQRAALARAFARRPRAMLLDEPFASIDVALRQRLRADMRRLLKARATPTILVTHDPAEAIELGDRIAVMQNGRIVESASPERLFNTPQTVGGGAIFPGAQAVEFTRDGDRVETAFGDIEGLKPNASQGALIIHKGGVVAERADSGPCRIVDCRFEGPDWLVAVAIDPGAGKTLKACTSGPIEPGRSVALRFDPERLRVVAS